MRHHPLAELQRRVGNQAIKELLHSASPEQGAPEKREAPAASEAEAPQPVLGPGRALDPVTRSEMGQRLGSDLGDVRIHDDAAAQESARRLHALAYTLGERIVLRSGESALTGPERRRLLAHELAHTVQQRRDPRPRIQRQPAPDATVDVDVEPTPPVEAERLRSAGVNLPTVSPVTSAAIGASPYATVYPDYQQDGNTCGAASLVAALLIWDREHWDPAQPNSRLVDACDLTLLQLERHGEAAVQRWARARMLPAAGGDAAANLQRWRDERNRIRAALVDIRDRARRPGASVPEPDFQEVGYGLYFLWNQGHGPGLESSEIFESRRLLGLLGTGSSSLRDFDSMFTNGVTTGLAPDEMAQVSWYAVDHNKVIPHAFIIGRLSNGKWFLSDQGVGVHYQADSPADLKSAVRTACNTGNYWLYTGDISGMLNPGSPGVQRLAGPGATHQALANIIPVGSALGQVDAGYLTIGDDVTAVRYVGREYTLAAAQAMLPGGAGGGVIVEMPAGVFNVYTTSAVSDANLDQTSLDAGDSAKMLLGGRRAFDHAWLILGNRFGVRRSWFQVY